MTVRRTPRERTGWPLGVVMALGAGFAVPNVARAEDPRVVIAPTDYQGDVEPDVRKRLEERLAEGLGMDGLQVVAASDGSGHVCADADCYHDLAEADDAAYVVAMSVSSRERVYQVSIVLIDGADGSRITEQSDMCEICGPDEVGAQVLAGAAAIRDAVETAARGQPRLSVTSNPSGAQVFVDGTMIGTTPLDTTIEPGTHMIRVGGDGLIAQERELLFVEGGKEVFAAELATTGGRGGRANAAGGAHRRLLIAGGVTFGVGVAALGAGIPLLVIHGRENKMRCDGTDVDINGRCRYTYNTLPAGIGLAAGGGALAIVGAVLLGIGSKRKRAAAGGKASAHVSFGLTETTLTVRF